MPNSSLEQDKVADIKALDETDRLFMAAAEEYRKRYEDDFAQVIIRMAAEKVKH